MEETIKTETLAVTEIQPQQSKQDKKASQKKTLIIVTYVIALLCLLAGLLVPLYNFRADVSLEDKMMLKYIPQMFNDLYSFFAKEALIPEGLLLNWFPISGEVAPFFMFDSLIGLLYAVMCVIGLFMLIPVCAGKKTKNTSANAALIVEILAIVFVAAYICFHTYTLIALKSAEIGWDNYNFFIAIGGTLLMAIIQSIAAKGSVGVSKTIGVILTAFMVICLLDVTMFLKALEGPFTSFSELIQSGSQLGFVTGDGVKYLDNLGIGGITVLLALVMGGGDAAAEILANENGIIPALYVLVIIIALLTVINLLSDIIGLGTGKKFNSKGQAALNTASNTYALVRYILTFLVAAVVIILTFFAEGVTAGLYLYAFEVFMLIQLINAIGRTVAAISRYKKYEVEKDHVAATIEINDTTYAEQAVASAAPAAEEQAYSYQPNFFGENPYEETASTTNGNDYNNNPQNNYTTQNGQQMSFDEAPDNFGGYNQQPNYGQPYAQTNAQQSYNGMTDSFMDTLTDSEKQEFSDIFLMKNKGFVRGVPDYQLNASNEDFFPAVFVHINRYRTICSDGLLGKMYKQLGKVI